MCLASCTVPLIGLFLLQRSIVERIGLLEQCECRLPPCVTEDGRTFTDNQTWTQGDCVTCRCLRGTIKCQTNIECQSKWTNQHMFRFCAIRVVKVTLRSTLSWIFAFKLVIPFMTISFWLRFPGATKISRSMHAGREMHFEIYLSLKKSKANEPVAIENWHRKNYITIRKNKRLEHWLS